MRFWVMEPEDGLFGTKWAYALPVGITEFGESIKCPVCGGPVSQLEWLPPHYLKLSSAKPQKWPDFLWGAGFMLAVSSRFKALYEAHGLTGIERFYEPAVVVRAGRLKAEQLVDPPEYHVVQIHWNGANVNDLASEVVRRPHPLGCSYCRGAIVKMSHLIIDEETWDGSDIFIPRGKNGSIVVSERLGSVIRAYGLTNALLVPAEKYAYDEHRTGRGIGLWYVNES